MQATLELGDAPGGLAGRICGVKTRRWESAGAGAPGPRAGVTPR